MPTLPILCICKNLDSVGNVWPQMKQENRVLTSFFKSGNWNLVLRTTLDTEHQHTELMVLFSVLCTLQIAWQT